MSVLMTGYPTPLQAPGEPHLLYGFDALCGWCYGFVPAMRAVRDAYPTLPIVIALPGLVTGERVGPYAEMEGYIRGASERLRTVTGRAPSEAFFEMIRRPGVRGDSAPPTAAMSHVRASAPDGLLPFAHAIIEAHFEHGADLNEAPTYTDAMSKIGIDAPPPDLSNRDVIEREWAAGRVLGIQSFPTLAFVRGERAEVMPSAYDPATVTAWVGERVSST